VNRDFSIDVEPQVSQRMASAPQDLGHVIKSFDDSYMDFGSGQCIWRLDPDDIDRGFVAASDSSRDSLAAGF